MSRILKALTTIESKGATLTLPREARALRPKRRGVESNAELSLASLEAYLQAALSPEQRAFFYAGVEHSVTLFCDPGAEGPALKVLEHAEFVDESAQACGQNWASRDDGPAPQVAIADREHALEIDEPQDAMRAAEASLDSLALTLLPDEVVLETAELAPWDFDEQAWELCADAPGEIEPSELVEELDFDSHALAVSDDQSAWTDEMVAFPAGAETLAIAAAEPLAGWPDALPNAPSQAIEEAAVEVDFNAFSRDVEPPKSEWLERHELLPAAANEALWLSAPDWVEVDAAIEALPLVAPPPKIAPVTQPPATIVRQRITSRDLLPDPAAWDECRGIAEHLLGACAEQQFRVLLLIELSPAAGNVPLTAPLAAMLAETSQNRVLLIDADVGRATAVDELRGETPPGLAEVSARPDAWQEFVLQSAVPKLDLLPSGKGPTSTLNTNFAARQWLKAAARSYPVILLHASWPGGGLLPRLAEAADATFLVTPLGTLDEEDAQAAAERLREYGANLAGCIVIDAGDTVAVA